MWVLGLVLLATMEGLLLPEGQVGNARFRVPLEPFLALLAAGGLLASTSVHDGPAPAGTGLERRVVLPRWSPKPGVRSQKTVSEDRMRDSGAAIRTPEF